MADIRLETEYGGYSIQWVDFDRTFSIFRGGTKVKGSVRTLKMCQDWIDSKNKQKFKRVSILLRVRWKGPRCPGEATSLIDDEYVWTVSGKDRSKRKIDECWLDTPWNRQILDTVKGLEAQGEQLDREIKALEAGAARLTAEMMIKEAQ